MDDNPIKPEFTNQHAHKVAEETTSGNMSSGTEAYYKEDARRTQHKPVEDMNTRPKATTQILGHYVLLHRTLAQITQAMHIIISDTMQRRSPTTTSFEVTTQQTPNNQLTDPDQY